jgi:hypothetical protein
LGRRGRVNRGDVPIAVRVIDGLAAGVSVRCIRLCPNPLPEYKHRILALCAALLAGLFGWFLSGEIGLRIEALQSRFGDLAVRAGGDGRQRADQGRRAVQSAVARRLWRGRADHIAGRQGGLANPVLVLGVMILSGRGVD